MSTRTAVLGALLSGLLVACGDGGTEPSNVIAAELVGSWTADPSCLPTCGLVLVSVADAADSVNLTSFGLVTRMTMSGAGRVELSSSVTGAPSVGSGRTQGAVLIVSDPSGAVDTIDYTVVSNRLELRFRRQFVAFDFTGDGQNDPARAIWRLRKE